MNKVSFLLIRFIIGLLALPCLIFFKQGIWCWIIICLTRYLIVSSRNKEKQGDICKTKEEFHAKGFYPPEDYFDENGNFIGRKKK